MRGKDDWRTAKDLTGEAYQNQYEFGWIMKLIRNTRSLVPDTLLPWPRDLKNPDVEGNLAADRVKLELLKKQPWMEGRSIRGMEDVSREDWRRLMRESSFEDMDAVGNALLAARQAAKDEKKQLMRDYYRNLVAKLTEEDCDGDRAAAIGENGEEGEGELINPEQSKENGWNKLRQLLVVLTEPRYLGDVKRALALPAAKGENGVEDEGEDSEADAAEGAAGDGVCYGSPKSEPKLIQKLSCS